MKNRNAFDLLNSTKIPTVFLFMICLFVIFAGIFGTYKAGVFVDNYERKVLLSRAENAAVLIDPTLIQKLSGSGEDVNINEYQILKNKMILLKKTNPDARFIYLLGLHNDNQLFFFVDSEDINAEGYSAPGDLYNTPAPGEIRNFISGDKYTNGPYKDAWGNWVSGYSPVIDPNTGNTLAMFGMDIDSKVFENGIIYIRILIGTIVALLSFFILSLIFIINKSRKNNEEVSLLQNDMMNSYNQLLQMQELVKIGRVVIWTNTLTMSWNNVVSEILEIPLEIKPTYEVFENKLMPDDKKNFAQMLDMLYLQKDNNVNIIFHLNNTTKTKRIRMVGVFYKAQDEKTNRIIATLQDVTNLG